MANSTRQNVGLGGGMVAYGRKDSTQEYMPVRLDDRGAVEMVNPRLSEQMNDLCRKMDAMVALLQQLVDSSPTPVLRRQGDDGS